MAFLPSFCGEHSLQQTQNTAGRIIMRDSMMRVYEDIFGKGGVERGGVGGRRGWENVFVTLSNQILSTVRGSSCTDVVLIKSMYSRS